MLARTAPDEVKHRGISFLLVDMRQPGVEVRPIKMMGGDSEFNEVFFTDARCPKGNVVGEVNGGWMVAMTLLGNERGAGAAVTGISFRNYLLGSAFGLIWPIVIMALFFEELREVLL